MIYLVVYGFEDRRYDDMYILDIDNRYEDITLQQENELKELGKTHYIFTKYDHFLDNIIYTDILAFATQKELLSFAKDVIDCLQKSDHIHCDDCLYEQFISIVEEKYQSCIIITDDNTRE